MLCGYEKSIQRPNVHTNFCLCKETEIKYYQSWRQEERHRKTSVRAIVGAKIQTANEMNVNERAFSIRIKRE